MNRLQFQTSLLTGITLAGTAFVPPVSADSVRVPIRTANTMSRQLDPNLPPQPIPTSPTPIPSDPSFVPPAVSGPFPPPPVPDQPLPPAGGGVMYNRPLGSDYQRPAPPKKEFPGDPGGFGSHRLPLEPVPIDPAQPGASGSSGLSGLPMSGTDRYGIAPPAGTLGQTYHRRSRLIDDDKHPRMAAVDVLLSENYDVSAKGLKAKWTGKVWHLTTDTLLPGIPHIYEVVAEWGPENAKQREVRTVRLIMNRVVDLEF